MILAVCAVVHLVKLAFALYASCRVEVLLIRMRLLSILYIAKVVQNLRKSVPQACLAKASSAFPG